MTTLATKTTIKGLVLGLIAMTGLATTSGAASAMELQNCTDGGVGVRVTGQDSGRVIAFRLEPGQKRGFQTSRGEKWRLNLNPIGKDVQYSNFAGNFVGSFVRIAGNLEVTRGLKCNPAPKPAPEPIIDETEYQVPPAHYDWCFAKYRSYRASDNTYQPFNGPRRECYSPYL